MIKIITYPPRHTWDSLARRSLPDDSAIDGRVAEIMRRVREGGDAALRALTAELDGATLAGFEVDKFEIEAAAKRVDPALKDAIATAAHNIRAFHAAQVAPVVDMETMPGVRCVQRAIPIQRVGLYIPGGSAPLFSTVLMLAIPACLAGCPEVILCTPPDKNGSVAPEILYAAAVCGVTRIFRAGGAQAVAAMAYGTETIPKADKIFGPGNRYVTRAKQMAAQESTAIDMPAGPSEVLVMADGTARAGFVAADMLSQAEHGADSQCVLVTDSADFADEVSRQIETQLSRLARGDAARKALSYSRIIVLDGVDDMVDFANLYAAEHLIISMEDAWSVAGRITAAGSVFIGNYSPESAGDYASGTNHTLPTAGWARSFGGVTVDSFVRKVTFQEISEEGLRTLSGAIITMAGAEGLDAHANAVKIRIKNHIQP